MNLFDKIIKLKLGDSMNTPKLNDSEENKYPESDSNEQDFIPYEGLYDEGTSVLPNDDEYVDHGLLIDAEVMLPQNGEHMKAAQILGRVKNSNGKYIGKYDQTQY